MTDYTLTVKGIEALIDTLSDQSKTERLVTYSAIMRLIDEISAILIRRKIENSGAEEHIVSLKQHVAQAAGLVDFGRDHVQYTLWCRASLNSLDNSLKSINAYLASP